jgi:FkbM family methyltransferase
VFLNNVGLSDRPETATMKIYGEYAGSNSLYERRSALATHPSFASFREQSIQLTTLDAYLEETKVDCVDMLKIDVEGHELKVLQGASAALLDGRIRCVQFEYGGCFLDSGATLKEVYELLSLYGYKIFRLLPYGKIRIGSFESGLENYQYSNWVAMR